MDFIALPVREGVEVIPIKVIERLLVFNGAKQKGLIVYASGRANKSYNEEEARKILRLIGLEEILTWPEKK